MARRDERGMSLLEVMVAATLLVSAVVVTSAVLDSSSTAVTTAGRRTTATNLATRELETMRTARYETLGFATSHPDYVASFEGRPTVVATTPAFTPTATEVVDGTTYAIRRHITWEPVTVGATTVAQGFKRLTVIVTWDGAAGVRQDSAANRTDPFACPSPALDAAPPGGLSGVVNTYHPGTAPAAAGSTVLSVGAAAGAATPIAPGDMLLVIQLQGAGIDGSDTDAYGDGVAGPPANGARTWGASGRYEYVLAGSAVVGGRLVVTGNGAGGGLVNSYAVRAFDPADPTDGQVGFQVIRVPTYPSTAIGSGLTALPWNGTVGGVLAVDVAGTLTIDGAVIDVDGRGFRGGGPTNATVLAAPFATTAASASQKGEGAAGTPRVVWTGTAPVTAGVEGLPGGAAGRGAPANAGGGARADSGGGGGANGGAGGAGGSVDGAPGTGGSGGAAAPASPTRLFLGGGGGAGGANDASTDRNGGPGGGLVLVRADEVRGTGTITARGAAGQTGVSVDGGGGGGAGGTVVVVAPGGMDGLTVDVRGGAGAGAPFALGAGGGGGGGVVLTTAEPVAALVDGGAAGASAAAAPASAGAAGVAGRLTAGQLTGIPLGAGCQPALTVTTTALTPTVANPTGGTATWRVRLENPVNRGTASGVTVTVPLPSRFTLASTTSVLRGPGAPDVGATSPVTGATSPSWGPFTIPGGSWVEIVFNATVPSSVPTGTYSVDALAAFDAPWGRGAAGSLGATTTTDDVTVVPFTCAKPWTDPAPGPVTGVVNTYFPGTESVTAGATTLPIGAPAGAATPITAGDLLVVMQMQDATIDATESDAYGDGVGGDGIARGVTSLGQSGRYEYVLATADPAGGSVRIRGRGPGGGLVHAYTAADATTGAGARTWQVIRVPTYPDGTVLGAGLTALPWNGAVGGVLAVDVAGTFDLAGQTIDVTGRGFRGGGQRNNGWMSPLVRSATDLASKGEGVAGTPRFVFDGTTHTDRGAGVQTLPNGPYGNGGPGNAGGGGTTNGGGGGGGNGGAGGRGGNTLSNATSAFGGGPVAGSVSRLVLGGGGGAGGSDAATTAQANGGPGGGIVLVRAQAVTGTGTVRARGAAGLGAPSDGGGGGGAGGSVLIAARVEANLAVDASGGAGGPGLVDHGAGGGGGGGVVIATDDLDADIAGGAAGSPSRPNVTAGDAGTTVTTATADQVPGIGLGAGCEPLLLATKTTSTPSRLRVRTPNPVSYTIRVTNPAGRPTVSGVAVTDPLPSGFTLAGPATITTSSGAVTRTGGTDPTVGATSPTWTGFTVPGGEWVELTFPVAMNSAAIGTYQNAASAVGATGSSTVQVSYDPASATTDDVTLAAVVQTLPVTGITDDTAAWGVDPTVLTGVINTYWPGTASVAAGATSITLGPATGAPVSILPGDLVLVIQMQDAAINSTNSVDYGDGAGGATGAGATNLNQSGRFEYAMATSAVGLGGGTLTLTSTGAGSGLVNAYNAAAATGSQGVRSFQVVRVPEYTSVTIGPGLTAAPWDPVTRTGGILAFDAIAGINLNGQTIDVTGRGFRGGGNPQVGGGTTASDWVATTNHGVKGEGIAGTPRHVATATGVVDLGAQGYPNGDHARGAPGNAGGGGNRMDAGGGGGGNGGSGGGGGRAFNGGSEVGGVGGAGVPGDERRLVLGGGGGSGHANSNAGPVSNGGAGGGMVLVRTTALTGSGTVVADGAPGQGGAGPTENDGAGGGGAGGSILFFHESGGAGLTLRAHGGAGGAAVAPRGGGGGGGGGVILTNKAVAARTVAGGAAGAENNPANVAAAGAAGISDGGANKPDVRGYQLAAAPGVSLTGTVNRYWPGASGTVARQGDRTIALGPSTGAGPAVSPGDLLLVVQVQDARIATADDGTYGSGTGSGAAGTTDLGSAGLFEYVIATSALGVGGGTVTVAGTGMNGGLRHTYTQQDPTATQGARRFQVVRVPVAGNATLTGNLTAPAWNGTTGGIIALEVTGVLDLGGRVIDADQAGFRGGGGFIKPGRVNRGFVQSTADANVAGGSKGEGVAGTPRRVRNGTGVPVDLGVEGYPVGSHLRGAPGNAGGGAGGDEGGAGGGGNGGAGGTGGNTSDQPSLPGGGAGGAAVPGGVSRLVFGGGGGAGDQDNSPSEANPERRVTGGDGGGLVVVRATQLTGTGTIRARGQGAEDARAAGAAGGGAGGTVVLLAGSGHGGVSVDVSGGAGGNAQSGHGRGGGGGGGRVFTNGTLAAATVSGGSAGGGTGNPATAGAAGSVVISLTAAELPGVTPAGVLGVGLPAPDVDGRAIVSADATPAFDAGQYVDVAFPTLFPPTAEALPGLTNLRVRARFANEGFLGTACVYGELRRRTGDVLLVAGGTLGTAAAPVCTTGQTMVDLDATGLVRAWTGEELNDLVLRLYLRSSDGTRVRIDQARFQLDWQERSPWVLPGVIVTGPTAGVSTPALTDGVAFAGDGAVYRMAGPPAASFTARSVTFTFAGGPPSIATVVGANLSLTWSGPAATCWWAEVLDGTTVTGTLGSAAAPTCRTGTGLATDLVALPPGTLSAATALGLRVYWRTPGGAVELDRVAVTVTWSAT